jgi:hypothetical protein
MLKPVQSERYIYGKMRKNALNRMVLFAKLSAQYIQSYCENTDWVASKCTSPFFCLNSLNSNATNKLKIGSFTI